MGDVEALNSPNRSKMVSVEHFEFSSPAPMVGFAFAPFTVLQRADNSVVGDDYTEANPIDGCYVRYKWYRRKCDKEVIFCSVHPTEPATLQCSVCFDAKVPVTDSYHCTAMCFSNAWEHHQVLHQRAASAVKENENELEETYGRFNSSSSTQKEDVKPWHEVGCSKAYTPTADDIGYELLLECYLVDAQTKVGEGPDKTLISPCVIPAPVPPRRMISVSPHTIAGHLDLDSRVSSSGTFTVLSYNILCDSYATSDLYSYCPTWALSWAFRRRSLLLEIVDYRADIICLQEVHSDHFEEYFAPKLNKLGYEALFKRKSSEVSSSIDGCATFFRRDRFSLVKKYEYEFNEAARSLADTLVPGAQRKIALDRLAKDNIALITVLEEKFINHGTDYHGKRQLVCVANTHVSMEQELTDTKLWQVNTLLKELEKIAKNAEMAMLLCGDFSSVPGSAPHSLLAMGKIDLDPLPPGLEIDPLGILRPFSKFTHQLPLVSAYSTFTRGDDDSLTGHKRKRMDLATNEPQYTTYTRDFIGTHDYIFYSADVLKVESLLSILDEDNLQKYTALPNQEWSSDHLALFAQFRYKPRCGT